ncbi:MAG: AAA domain-containing protein [Chthoniobacterales bacterium]
MPETNLSESQQRLLSVLEYLEELDKLTRRAAFEISEHGGLAIYQQDASGLPGIILNRLDAEGEIWMGIERLRPTRPPAPPVALASWLLLRDDPTAEPKCRETIIAGPKPDKIERLEDHPEITTAFDHYLAEQWEPWTQVELPKRQTIAIYDKLFNLSQTMEGEGAESPIELVWGIGVAVWNHDQRRLRYPLLSHLVEIDPIGVNMTIRIRPRQTEPRVELDPYRELEIAGAELVEKRAQTVLRQAEETLSPFDPKSFEEILSTATANLDPQGCYWPREAEAQPAVVPPAANELRVTDTWVLFSRRKTTNFLVEDLRRLKEKVVRKPLPAGGPSILVEDPVGPTPIRERLAYRGISNAGSSASAGLEVRELYFPRAFNNEQVSIVEKLDQADGVVVQGPPGTGKTHTIANIICHYLALGKRVLVTSKGEPALAALRDQIPEKVRALTVSLLTREREGLKQLEQSVRRITDEVSYLNKDEKREEIRRIEHKIDRQHQQIAAIDRDLAEWARCNTTPAPPSLGGVAPEELARRVVAGVERYAWFPDALRETPEHEPQFCNEDIATLARSRQQLGKALQYLGQRLPASRDFADAATVAAIHCDLQTMGAIEQEVATAQLPRLRRQTTEVLGQASALLDAVEQARALHEACQEEWLAWLRTEFAKTTGASSPHLVVVELNKLLDGVAALEAARASFATIAVELPPEADTDPVLVATLRRAADGKRPFGLLSFGQSTLRAKFNAVRLNGSPPKEHHDWQVVVGYVEFLQNSRTIVARWNAVRAEFDGPEITGTGGTAIRTLARLAERIGCARKLAEHVEATLPEQVDKVFGLEFRADAITHDAAEMRRLAKVLRLHLSHGRLAAAKNSLQAEMKKLAALRGEAFDAMRGFLANVVGSQSAASEEIESQWQAFLDELDRLAVLHDEFAEVERTTALIRQSGAPVWAQRLGTRPAALNDDPEILGPWNEAWTWSRQRGYVEAIDGRSQIFRLNTERRAAEKDLARANEDLVEQLTWLRLREVLDRDRSILPALQLYMGAIVGIGAGTGRIRTPRLRANAREAMVRASEAVRCWIMPHWRISETLPAELASFDLVILDEASQSDAWAIPALLRAKKLLVVGDHKQVSPTSFAKESDVILLQRRFLQNLPFRAAMAPEKSIYDLAKVIFASDLVALREHFRCVEPIIEFSNQLCYNGEIRCLRVPTAEERLSPVLIDVFVRGGYRHAGSQKLNRPEAEAIVEEIRKIVTDPAMRRRSIGVVSLLGSEQARLILDLLIPAIGERAILDHRIRCGDAMTFQGREADIMFISMVSDAASLHAATGQIYEQRFNVAASRARDRMYLFRSFRREDLSDRDVLRARLLDHFTRPLWQDPAQVQSQRERCESGFERAVFDALAQRNYRILAQVPAGGYRIDLVVEGHHGRRLAIECDGDQYHTPDDWLSDITRQRALERIGWVFWRCWGSSFILDSTGCLDDLFAKLNELGIDAIGSAEVDLSAITEYREIEAAQPIDDDGVDQQDDDQPAGVPTRLEHVFRWIDAGTKDDQQPREMPTSPKPLPTETESPRNCVQVGDSVEFVFADDPADEIWVLITAGRSNPNLGLINVETPLARALLGAEEASEITAHLPGGSRKLRILHIHKLRRATSADEIDHPAESGLIDVKPSTHEESLPPRREGRRCLEIRVTQGMINQNLLVLTDWVNRGVVNVGETLAIECVSSGERFSTEVIEQGKKLRERGAIGRFYAAARVRAGNRVRMSEFAPRRWRLEKVGDHDALDDQAGLFG